MNPFAGGLETKIDDKHSAKYINSQIARHLPGPVPADARNAFYVEFKTGEPVDVDNDGIQVYPLDRIGYSFCAPDEAKVEIATLIDNVASDSVASHDDRGDQLIASGLCGPDSQAACPITRGVARFEQQMPIGTQDVQIPIIFALRRSPIDAEFYRGWSSLGVTSEFVEPTSVDVGIPAENPGVLLSDAKATEANTPELLSTVRDFNRHASSVSRGRIIRSDAGVPRTKGKESELSDAEWQEFQHSVHVTDLYIDHHVSIPQFTAGERVKLEANWAAANERRVYLVDKKLAGTIRPEEEAELREIDRLVDEYMSATAPSGFRLLAGLQESLEQTRRSGG